MKMNKKSFALAIKMLTSNYKTNLNLENKEDIAHVNLIFDILEAKGFTDQDVDKAVIDMMTKESSLFGKKLPPLEWFFTYADKQEPKPEQQAILEVNRIINHVDGYYGGDPVVFDNPVTNACVNGYGGIVQIAREINSRSKRDWIVKNLQNIWIACFNDGIVDNYCRGRTPIKYFRHVKGKSCKLDGYILEGVIEEEKLPVDFVGDEAKCQELLDSSKLLEEPKNLEIDKIIAKLEEGWKNKRKS